MKKILFISLLSFVTFVSVNAEKKDIDVDIRDGETAKSGHPHPRMPIFSPNVSIEDYTLFFDCSCIGCMVHLLQDDVTVYSDIVSEDGEVELPSNLSGIYQLQIEIGSFTFVGEIELNPSVE